MHQDRFWARACHLSVLGGLIIPFGYLIGPLIIWHQKKYASELVRLEGIHTINFCISIILFELMAFISSVVSFGASSLVLGNHPIVIDNETLGLIFWIVYWVFNPFVLLFVALKTYRLDEKKYPVSLKFLKV
jgi:uncharacterized Tic20 family protein